MESGPQRLNNMVDSGTRRRFETLVSAAYADGVLADEEKILLQRKAQAMNLSSREVEEILSMGEKRRLSVTVPPTAAERESLLEDLIDVVAADRRIEPGEYHLLARFAHSMNLPLSELRARLNRRLSAAPEPRRETRRDAPRARIRPEPGAPGGPTPDPARLPSPPAPPPSPPALASPAPPGPIRLGSTFAPEPAVGDLPPVTLQLLKQSIMFDSEADSLVYIGRTLGVDPEAAQGVRREILQAFPDLRPGSNQIGPSGR